MNRSQRTFINQLFALILPTLAVAQAAAAEPVLLESAAAPGQIVHVDSLLEVGGDLKVTEQGKIKPLKMSVVGKMTYDEKCLAIDQDKNHFQSVRSYQVAEATIKIEKGSAQRKLRDTRRLIGANAANADVQLFSPRGPLTRDELDLIEIPANTLLLDQLLPKKAVAAGDRWQHPDDLLAMLLGLDAVSQSDVYSELKEVDGSAARMEIEGHVEGAIGGVSTELKIKGRYKFHREHKRITWFAILVEEKRSIGHVGPGADVVAKLQLTVHPVATEPSELSSESLQGLVLDAKPEQLVLEYEALSHGFTFLHDRRWYPTLEKGDHLAMRLVDRGELIAQCNVSELAKSEPGQGLSLTKFQSDIETALTKTFQRFVQASEGTTSTGNKIYRVIAEGTVSELPIQWNYYLVSNADGRQAVFAFTLEGSLAPQLGESDQEVVRSLSFEDPPLKTASQPTIATPKK